MGTNQKPLPIWSLMSLLCPLLFMVVALCLKNGKSGFPTLGVGNIGYLGINIFGILFGLVGFVQRRWLVVAVAGIALSSCLILQEITRHY
jgi:hypothetical protein